MSNASDRARQEVHAVRHQGESARIQALLRAWEPNADFQSEVQSRALGLVEKVRAQKSPNLLEAFLAEYGLSTDEGVGMMCLAEALLRVPDSPTIDALIEDKIVPGRWGRHLNRSSSSLVNASTWALLLTGKLLNPDLASGIVDSLRATVKRIGEPAVRVIIGEAMKELGRQFVLGRDIDEALEHSGGLKEKGYTFSYDMLGEAARSEADARRYHLSYSEAISALAPDCTGSSVRQNPGISVKLSALHPRFEHGQRERVMTELLGRVSALAQIARSASMGFNIDAEESERLDLTLDIIEALMDEPALAHWEGFGVVVQAYHLDAGAVIDWLHTLAKRRQRRIMVRLVKGAYWDTQIKRAQVMGLETYPVFTRKAGTDLSYLTCAQKLLAGRDCFYPQFATHNAHTMATIMALAGRPDGSFEFQRLHGMGESLHRLVREEEGFPCRVYAPVGAHRDLLAYLVRRLLENGANSSFVNQLLDQDIPSAKVVSDPLDQIRRVANAPSHPDIPQPADLYRPERRNSAGRDLEDRQAVETLQQEMVPFKDRLWQPLPDSIPSLSGAMREAHNPANPREQVGVVREGSVDDVDPAIERAEKALDSWQALSPGARAALLNRAADLYETHFAELMALAGREAGKTLLDGVAEIREAVDFLRYYASRGENLSPSIMPKGVFVCISPWNFPLAIFTGQVSAALAAGNCVIAKPAEQTPLMASRAVELMHEAGIPKDVLQCLPGPGETVGAMLAASVRIDGVCFTGSIETARYIHRSMALTGNSAAPLIAETGGINAMLVDSTALPEQVVRDVLVSAFQSAGQRCSALRILYLQEDIKDRVLELLFGAMDELQLGDPLDNATDVGPVIDASALAEIRSYCEREKTAGRLLKQLEVPGDGHFMGPSVVEVAGIGDIGREIFGPVLHVATFAAGQIEKVLSDINRQGYGLTLGLHSRVDARVQQIIDRAHVGNIYVNRNQIGAVVGTQPFGGEGLSGTGPKAGGPLYLSRFCKKTPSEAPSAGSQHPAPGLKIEAEELQAWFSAEEVPSEPIDPGKVDAFLEQVSPALPTLVVDAVRSLTRVPAQMPGPTGESNHWKLYPRGNVLCLGPGVENLRIQACQALALGNRVLALGGEIPELSGALADWPLEMRPGKIDPAVLASVKGLSAVCLWGRGEDLRPWRSALAERDGVIAPLLTDSADITQLVLERHVCVDTTASGGNTTLLVQTA